MASSNSCPRSDAPQNYAVQNLLRIFPIPGHFFIIHNSPCRNKPTRTSKSIIYQFYKQRKTIITSNNFDIEYKTVSTCNHRNSDIKKENKRPGCSKKTE